MPNFPLRLVKHIELTAALTLRSGTRVGGSREDLNIGGMENPVIRDPVTREPYLPGSSLKGKLRSMIEYRYKKGGQEGQPCGCADSQCPACNLFGPHMKPQHGLGPSRLIVRDAFLSSGSRLELEALQGEGLPMVEVKTENIIDRRTGIAADRGLRTQERVPRGSGTKFDLAMTLRVFEGDNEDQLKRWVQEGLELVQREYLGGSGTRGYGWISIENLQIADHPYAVV